MNKEKTFTTWFLEHRATIIILFWNSLELVDGAYGGEGEAIRNCINIFTQTLLITWAKKKDTKKQNIKKLSLDSFAPL